MIIGRNDNLIEKLRIGFTTFLCLLCVTACEGKSRDPVGTVIPDEHLPTIIAQTAAAAGVETSDTPENNTADVGGTDTQIAEVSPTLNLTMEAESKALATLDTPDPTSLSQKPPSAIEAYEATAPPVVPEMIGEGFVPPTVVIDSPYPEAIIKIYRPGDFSRVISPFRVVANVLPGLGNKVQIELYGEDGRTLEDMTYTVMPLPGLTTANLVTEISFTTPAVAEAARLSVSVTDDLGRIRSVSSVNLILLSTGLTELKGYGDLRENIVIQQPIEGGIIQGGGLTVSGLARTGSDQPLDVELYDEQGVLVGEGSVEIVYSYERNYQLFIGEITYEVNRETPVRLVVRANGVRIPGTTYLASVVLILKP